MLTHVAKTDLFAAKTVLNPILKIFMLIPLFIVLISQNNGKRHRKQTGE